MRFGSTSWLALMVAGALAGCGGGGGSGGGTSGGGPIVSRSGNEGLTERTGAANFTNESNRNWGLQAVGATTAHSAGHTGTGVTVGIVDTGIDLDHPDFAGAISPNSIDIVTGTYAMVDDFGGHGTAVAGIIGARRDGYDVVGVAPDSTLLAVRADKAGTCETKCSFTHADLARATDHAVAHGASILNFSLGGATVSQGFRDALAAAAAQDRIVIAAAGNSSGSEPIDPAYWAATQSGGLGIAVGAVDSSNQLASFSNKAGATMNNFLVAPGVSIATTKNGGGTYTVSGTSFSAPHVAGAAAVVWAAAPYLTGAQVVDILLSSATDLGAPGIDAVYGRGLLNLAAAQQPLGQVVVPTGANVADGGALLAETSLSLGGAFGDSAPTGLNAVFLDAYGRPFNTDLSETVRRHRAPSGLSNWLDQSGEVMTRSLGHGIGLTVAAREPEPLHALDRHPGASPQHTPRFALTAEADNRRVAVARGFGLGGLTGLAAAAPEAAAPNMSGNVVNSPFLALAGDGTSLAASHRLGGATTMTLGLSEQGGDSLPGWEQSPDRRALLAELTREFGGGTVVGVQIGSLSESQGPLASLGGGAFAFDKDAETMFAGLFGAMPLAGKTTLFGRWGAGLTGAESLNGGLWREAEDIHSRTAAVGIAVRDLGIEGDRVAFSISRPLRVVAGAATMAVPVGRAMDGTILTRDQRIGLTPSGAETDFEISWTIPVAEGQRLVLGGMVAIQPGHQADAPPAAAVGAKYRLTW